MPLDSLPDLQAAQKVYTDNIIRQMNYQTRDRYHPDQPQNMGPPVVRYRNENDLTTSSATSIIERDLAYKMHELESKLRVTINTEVGLVVSMMQDSTRASVVRTEALETLLLALTEQNKQLSRRVQELEWAGIEP